MRRGFIRLRVYLTVALMLIAAGLLLIQPPAEGNASSAAPQGKGGEIKPLPSPSVPKKSAPPKRSTPPARASRANTPKAGNDAALAEIAFWSSIKDSTDPEDFRAYLEQYPNGKFAALAKNRLRNLEAAKAQPTPAASAETEASKTQPPTSNPADTAGPAQPATSNIAGETKEDAPRHFKKGKELHDKTKYAEAEAELRAAVRLDPNKVEYHRALHSSLLSQCKYAEAAAESREVVRLETTADNYLNLSTWLEIAGKLTEAETALREAIRLRPDYFIYHARLGGLLERQGRWTEAEAAFKEMMRVSSSPAEAHRNYGWAFLDSKPAEAERAYREAIRLASKEDYSLALDHVYLSRALASQKKWAEAEAEIREGIRLYRERLSGETQAVFWDELAKIFEAQGKLARAEGVYKEAFISFPKYTDEFHQLYGDFFGRQKRWAEAEAEYREALRLWKYSPISLLTKLGNTLKEQNKLTEAENQYRQALQTPVQYSSDHFESRRGFADLLERQNRLKEAEAEYRTLLGSNCGGMSAAVHSDFGDFLGRRNRWKEAEAEYRRAVQLNPKESKHQEKLQQAINAQKK